MLGICAATTLRAEPAAEGGGAVVTPERVRTHVEFLCQPELAGRGDAAAKAKAAEYLCDFYRHHHLHPLFEGGSYVQDIPGTPRDDGTPTVIGRNIGAWLPGSDPDLRDEVIIVSAHYDHLGTHGGRMYPGADDNASGVAMVLETARRLALRGQAPRRSIAFINFDLEEHLLWGSRWFVAHAPWPMEQIQLFVTADMLGRSLGNLPLKTVFVLGSEHAPTLRDTLAEIHPPESVHLARLGADLIGTRSDYGPFRDRKVPFLFFSTGEHPDYHTPQDTPDRIDYAKVAGVERVVEELCLRVGNTDNPPVWSKAAEPDMDEVRTLHFVSGHLLDAAQERKLTDVQRLLISNVRNRTGQIVTRGAITADERAWLIRQAQLLMLAVF
ncbi:MAG TPA: M28 family peptidase [Planctomycetaceae bacterium]|nr:M28 family peptidase [Planctomycetaceae bacterium]